MKQINLKVDDSIYTILDNQSKSQGISIGAWCRNAVITVATSEANPLIESDHLDNDANDTEIIKLTAMVENYSRKIFDQINIQSEDIKRKIEELEEFEDE